MTRYRVFKVKFGIVGYGTLASKAYPWLVTPAGVDRGWAFPTFRQALYFATTGERLRGAMSREERLAWRQRNEEFFAEWRALSKEHRANPDGSRRMVLP
jgi:hypothetical protein